MKLFSGVLLIVASVLSIANVHYFITQIALLTIGLCLYSSWWKDQAVKFRVTHNPFK